MNNPDGVSQRFPYMVSVETLIKLYIDKTFANSQWKLPAEMIT